MYFMASMYLHLLSLSSLVVKSQLCVKATWRTTFRNHEFIISVIEIVEHLFLIFSLTVSVSKMCLLP